MTIAMCFVAGCATGRPGARTVADAQAQAVHVGYALIYNGPGSAKDCPEAVARVAEKAGLSVRYVSKVADIPGLLPVAALLALGGTDDNIEPLRKRFKPDITQAIRQYVSDGGAFVGICGGAYLASQGYEDDHGFVHALGLIPATTDAFIENDKARILTVRWRGVERKMYYQYGPKFILKNPAESVDVVATYPDGSIAALLCSYGKGRVFVTGPHPEADESWRRDIKGGAPDWKPQPEIAAAIISELLARSAVGR